MPESGEEFRNHVIELLKTFREDIQEDYKPFSFLPLSADIKALFQQIEGWRELKILNYGTSSVLFKTYGKVLKKFDLRSVSPKNI